jgi:hypothetical protein
MDNYTIHWARTVVDEHRDRRTREASAERLARQIRGTTRKRTRILIGALRSAHGRRARPVRVRPES